MSKRAKERALEAYPYREDFYRKDGIARSEPLDLNMEKRFFFQQGYEQAEKDLGWRSAKDEKPNPSEWVVVCIKDHETPQCLALATYNEYTGKWITGFDDGEEEEYFPDYWLRIPETFNEK